MAQIGLEKGIPYLSRKVGLDKEIRVRQVQNDQWVNLESETMANMAIEGNNGNSQTERYSELQPKATATDTAKAQDKIWKYETEAF